MADSRSDDPFRSPHNVDEPAEAGRTPQLLDYCIILTAGAVAFALTLFVVFFGVQTLIRLWPGWATLNAELLVTVPFLLSAASACFVAWNTSRLFYRFLVDVEDA